MARRIHARWSSAACASSSEEDTARRVTAQSAPKEAAARLPGVVLCIHHRVGRLEVGEPSIVIAAVAAHRAEAYAASRFAIERVKQISPVWKREHLVDGASWVEGAAVHPDDPAPLEDAWRRACL